MPVMSASTLVVGTPLSRRMLCLTSCAARSNTFSPPSRASPKLR